MRFRYWLAILALTTGCATAQADLHAAAVAGLGIVTAAENDPTLKAEAVALMKAAADKADPKDAPKINAAIDTYTSTGATADAKAVLSSVASASAPK